MEHLTRSTWGLHYYFLLLLLLLREIHIFYYEPESSRTHNEIRKEPRNSKKERKINFILISEHDENLLGRRFFTEIVQDSFLLVD